MKNLNSTKLFLTTAILCVFAIMPVNAQSRFGHSRPSGRYGTVPPSRRTYDVNTYYGLRFGLSASHVSSDAPDLNGSSSKTGLNVGAVVGMQLSHYQPIFFETGLSYIEKGGKSKVSGEKFSIGLNYLEVPLMASYRYNFNDNIQFQLATGPYLAVGICGKYKYENTNGTEADIDYFGDDGADFKRFDMGWQVGTGFSIHRVYIGYTFQAGFLNTADSNVNFRTRNHMISVGYDF